jgi:hypothetical protein
MDRNWGLHIAPNENKLYNTNSFYYHELSARNASCEHLKLLSVSPYYAFRLILFSERNSWVIAVLHRIRWAPESTLVRKHYTLTEVLSWFSLVPPGKCWNSTLQNTTVTSFRILVSSSVAVTVPFDAILPMKFKKRHYVVIWHRFKYISISVIVNYRLL